MKERRTRRGLALGLASLAVGAAAPWTGCALGLDPSLIGAAVDAAAAPEHNAPQVAADGHAGLPDTDVARIDPPPATRCSKDEECTLRDGCLAARCDVARGRCVYDVCKQSSACSVAACDRTRAACTAPATHGFHAGAFPLRGGVGCGGAAARCIAAVEPYVFVGTDSGVMAVSSADPTSAAPRTVAVDGLPFLPSAIVASGTRVYFVGAVQGSAPSYQLTLGWLDVPSDPFVTALTAHAVLRSFSASAVALALPAENDALLLVVDDNERLFPSALVRATPDGLGNVTLFPSSGIPQGARPVAVSAGRLVTARLNQATASAAFSLQSGAGTAAAQNGGEQGVDLGTPVGAGFTFAEGADGSLSWGAPTLTFTDGGDSELTGVRLAWLLGDGKDTSFDGSQSIALQTYPGLPPGTPVAGPMAWVDPRTILVVSADRNDVQKQSLAQVATRVGGVTALAPNRKYTLPARVGATGVARAGAYVYVLVPGDNASVHVFAAGCDG